LPTPPPPEPVAVRNAQIEGTRVHIPHELELAVDKATFDASKDPHVPHHHHHDGDGGAAPVASASAAPAHS
jgi:hypothetical protein